MGGMAVIMPTYKAKSAWLSLSILLCGFASLAQSPEPPVAASPTSDQPAAPVPAASARASLPEPQPSGSISGTVVDATGAFIVGARVRIARKDPSANREVLSGDDGQFSLVGIPPGPFLLTITAPGFATQTFTGTLRSGEIYLVPQTTLAIATAVTEVRVVPKRIEVAEDEIKEEEKQRVLGVIPNFYVTYLPNAVPLSAKQKFELAWKTTVDPVNFGITGVIAGVQQAQNDFSGYGQGAQGFAKRYGASYTDSVASTFIGSAVLPSLLKQDPRYFYKGTGSKRSRILYALANAVICKGDNGHWQANYSSILGSLAAGGISNLYYPAKNRDGAELTFENALVGIGASAAANLLQEFLIRKLTPNGPNHAAAKSQSIIGKLSSTLVHEGD
jgi:carboxypeptidase family protein